MSVLLVAIAEELLIQNITKKLVAAPTHTPQTATNVYKRGASAVQQLRYRKRAGY